MDPESSKMGAVTDTQCREQTPDIGFPTEYTAFILVYAWRKVSMWPGNKV